MTAPVVTRVTPCIGTKQAQRTNSTPSAQPPASSALSDAIGEGVYINVKLSDASLDAPLDLSIYDTIDARRAASLTYENTRMRAPSAKLSMYLFGLPMQSNLYLSRCLFTNEL